MNRWILSQGELVGTFDVLWSEGSRTTDPDPDYLRGTHDSVGHVIILKEQIPLGASLGKKTHKLKQSIKGFDLSTSKEQIGTVDL